MTESVLLLDYDHTLYPPAVKALTELDKRITAFVEAELGLPREEADRLRRELCRQHGTTLRGLQVLHAVLPDRYFDFIHQVEDRFHPPFEPLLLLWLEALNLPVYVFTNARRDWAEKGLRSLRLWKEGAEEAGDGGEGPSSGERSERPAVREIFDLSFSEWVGKPHPSAYARVEERLRALHGHLPHIVFADDSLANLSTAKARGWTTLWVGGVEEGAALPAAERPWDLAAERLWEIEPARLFALCRRGS